MRTAVVVLACVMVAGVVLAQDAPQKQPAKEQEGLKARMDALVKQLGSDEFDEREAATEELKKIGKPAIPALKEALKSDDAEIRSRAQSLLKALEGDEPDMREKSGPSEPALPGWGQGKIIIRKFGNLKEFDLDLKELRKKLEELRQGLDEEPTFQPFGLDEDKDFPFPEELREVLEQLRKRHEKLLEELREGRKGMEDPQKWFEELRKRMGELEPEGERLRPKTELPGEGEEKEKEGRFKSGKTVIIKRLVWKDGKLVLDEEQTYDARLPGLSADRASDVLRYHLSLEDDEGVIVTGVEKDSPFAEAGIAKHDVITKVDGRTVGSREELTRAIAGKEKVTLQVIRRGEQKTFDVNLGR